LKKIHLFVLMAFCSLVGQWFFLTPMAHAEDSIGDSIDCTVRVDYVDDPRLTHEERLRLMDKAFLESLNKYELCRSAKEAAEASEASEASEAAAGNGATAVGDSPGGDSGDSSGNSSGEAGGTSAGESAASSAMSGTEAPENDSSAEGIETAAQGGLQGSQNPKEADSNTGGNNTSGKMKQANGKLPEDIPTAQNDDALAAQIRYAAENETDPVKREQLWNEYRKYKGLPTQ
jgi:hypothetical protein